MEDRATEPREASLSALPLLVILRGALLVLLVVGLVGGLHLYLARRMAGGFGLEGASAWAVVILFATLFAAIPAGFWAGRRRKSLVTRATLWLSHVWLGVFGLLLSAVAAADLVRGVVALVTGSAPWTRTYAGAALVAGLGAAAYGARVARSMPRVRRRELPIRGLGEGLRGLRVVQLSDIHIGQTLDGKFLERLVQRVNALEPDVVAVTGDLVDGFPSAIRGEVAPLAGLRASLGVFYVSGNHEYYYGGPAWEAEVRRLGVTVLRNEHRLVERGGARLAIAGVTDHDAGHFGEEHASRPDRALAGIPPEVPRLLLAHQPRTALKVQDRVDLQLSGHTHGGQLFPFTLFVRLQQPVIAGLHTVNGIPVYTHRGTGYWGPSMRVGAAPEIAELTLVPA